MTEQPTPSVTTWARLEPRSRVPTLLPLLEGRVHDPLWQLSVQWRLGEFAGEDAGSPIGAELTVSSAPLDAYACGGPAAGLPPGVPLDCLVGAEEPTPMTPAGRAESGDELATLLAEYGGSAAALAALVTAAPLAAPDEATAGIEGASYLAVVAGRLPDAEALAATLVAVAGSGTVPDSLKVPAADSEALVRTARAWSSWRATLLHRSEPGASAWHPDHLEHAFTVGVSGGEEEPLALVSRAWNGERLDWYDLDVDPAMPAPRPPTPSIVDVTTTTSSGLPTPLSFPGMPASRFFEFEDAAVNLAQLNISREDLGRLLVLEFACVYSNDWYLWPVEAAVGALHTVTSLTVRTTFGDTVQVGPVPSGRSGAAAADWQLFRPATGPGGSAAYDGLLLLPALTSPLSGEPVEEVRFLRDETANLAWAVEATVEGADGEPLDRHSALAAEGGLPAAPGSAGASDTSLLRYRFATDVPHHWFPLAPDAGGATRFRRLGVSRVHPDGTPLVVEPAGAVLASFQELWQEEVPREGAVVTRRDTSVRATDGTLWVWRARRKTAGRGEGSSGLRYDEAVPELGGTP